MTDPDVSPVPIAVLNPRGRDPFLDYRELPSRPADDVHAPVNFHAYAAATGGAFFNSVDEVIAQKRRFGAIIVLIRKRAWITLKAVETLKTAGIPVIISWKECSETQIRKQLRSLRAGMAYSKIIALANGILSPTFLSPVRPSGYSATEFAAKLRYIPTPYPVELPGWDFSTPLEEREGIFVGTREFGTKSRNHLGAIEALVAISRIAPVSRITVVNTEGNRGLNRLRKLSRLFPGDVFQIIESSLSYPDYMRLLASHRLVFQRDLSGVPGQVAGDCLLARTLCAGGNSAIEKLAFPALQYGAEDGERRFLTALKNDESYIELVEQSQDIAARKISFKAVARAFAEWELSR
jgi:hypothetical protein